MNPSRFTRFGVPIYEPQTAAEVDPWSAEESVRAALPLLDSTSKTDYLGYRACGFSVREAAALVGVGQRQVVRWRREDEIFRRWEEEGLTDLQHRVGDLILKHQFMRNMHLVLKIDGDALRAVAFTRDKSKLDADTKDWAKEAAKRYKAQDMTLMAKALMGDVSGDNNTIVNMQVTVNGEHVTSEAATKAAIRGMLKNFTVNNQLVEGEVLDSSDS